MNHNHIIIIGFLLMSFGIVAQTGINTLTPKGALDINSTTSGIVYPVVVLTDVTVQEISNPHPINTNIVDGTTVYNTNTNTPANIYNSVYPGIYVWDATKLRWIPQFSKRDHKLFIQDVNLRTGSSDGNQSITFDTSSNYPFTPKYNGKYKIEVRMQYGGGQIEPPPANQYVNFGAQVGDFEFIFNGGTSYTFTSKVFSGYNTDKLFNNPASANSDYYNDTIQTSYVIEEDLDITNTYTFSLKFDQTISEGFIDNGDLNNGGKGHIIINGNNKCTVEFTYIGE